MGLEKQATWAKSLLSIYTLWPKSIKPCPLHPQISLKPEFDTYILPKINLKNYSFSSLTILPLTLLKAPRPLQNPFINEKRFWKIPQWILLVGLWLSKSPFNAPIPTKTYEKLKNLKLNHKQISTLNLTLGCSVNDPRVHKNHTQKCLKCILPELALKKHSSTYCILQKTRLKKVHNSIESDILDITSIGPGFPGMLFKISTVINFPQCLKFDHLSKW